MFKRKILILLAIMLSFSLISLGLIRAYGRKGFALSEQEQILVTSFYPVHILTRNLVEGVEDVCLVNLTENHTGCLHDYQLTTQDMLTIESADMLIINGGDMELFVTAATKGQQGLTVVDASEGMDFLEGTEHHHDHDHAEDEDEHEDGHEDEDEHETEHDHATNGHVWLNTERYRKQLATIKEALCRLDSTHAQEYQQNYENYDNELQRFAEEYHETLAGLQGCEVVVFHDAFYYLCEELGIEVVVGVSLDAETALSAAQIAEVTDEIRMHGIRYLLAEEATGAVAEQIALETGTQVIYLDPLTSGDDSTEAYLAAMRQNMEQLKQLLK